MGSTSSLAEQSVPISFTQEVPDASSVVATSSIIYSYEQQRVLFWAPKLPAMISMFSSMLIAYILLRDRKSRLSKVFGRLWLGLSLGNVFITIMVLLGSVTSPSPSSSSGSAYYSYGNYGNNTTCTISGAVFHFVFVSTMIYNGATGIYYYISVHTNWSDQYVKTRVEPFMHAVAWLYPLIGAAIGVALDMYHPNKFLTYCWVSDVDDSYSTALSDFDSIDDDDDATHIHTQRKYRALFVFLSGLIEFNQFTACKLSSMFAIAFTVQKQQQLIKTKYQHSNVNGSTTSFGNNEGTNHNNGTTTSRGRTTLARQAMIQSILFTFACIIPYGCTIILRLLDLFWTHVPATTPTGFFIFSLLAQTLFPL